MEKTNKINLNICLLLRQMLIYLSFLLSSYQIFAQELTFKDLDPSLKSSSRRPSNFVPSDDFEVSPYFENKLWVEKAFVADNEGVLTGMRDQIRSWKDTEEYAKNWNLETTGLYNTPSRESRKQAINSGFLKYADKRLAGEMKDAEEGSALATVNKAQKALRPQADVGVSQNVKVKFRGKAIQGEGKMVVENPWVEQETNYRIFSNKLTSSAGKSFNSVGFRASTDYHITDGNWSTNFDQKLTTEVTARLTSNQTIKEMAFSSESERIIQLLFSKGW